MYWNFNDAVNLAAKMAGIKEEPKLIYYREQRKITLFDILFGDITHLINRLGPWPKIKYQLIY